VKPVHLKLETNRVMCSMTRDPTPISPHTRLLD